MDISRIDLNLLVVFEALMAEQSATRAALRLNLSQSAVSSALSRLRALCGDALFVRSKHGLSPTPRAQEIWRTVEPALALVRQGLEHPPGFDPATARRDFTLLLSDLGQIVYVPHLLARLERVAPGVGLRVQALSTADHAEKLDQGEADLAIGYLSKPGAGIVSEPLFEEHLVCIVRTGHSAIARRLTLEQYMSASHVVVSRRGNTTDVIDSALTRLGLRRNVALTVPNLLAIPRIVAQTDLVATVPYHLGVVLGAPQETRMLPLPFAFPRYMINQFWHRRHESDGGIAWLRALVQKLFASAEGPLLLERAAISPASNHGPTFRDAGRR